MTGLILVLTVLGALSYDLFFIGSFVGLLVVIELTEPAVATPGWRKRVWWFVILGLLGFTIVIAEQMYVTLAFLFVAS